MPLKGKVYLVGAGPGDPSLITLRGMSCLQKADVVVYDRLVDRRLLLEANDCAEQVYVGKGLGEKVMEQGEINQFLIDRALDGGMVVRLKGGDPFVFGRGGEEGQALAEAGVPFEIVPGITSAIAAPAYAGIPLTHRELASSFTVISGVEDPDKAELNVPWDVLAKSGGTLVVLMGWGTIDTITTVLTSHGMDPSTPAALIRWGTEPYQRTVTGTLVDIAKRGHEAGLGPPVVLVVGAVVDLRHQLRWFDDKPMFGKRVLVTRTRSQASMLSELLSHEGAEPIEVPAIEIAPLTDYSAVDQAISSLSDYDWAIFTSANGVRATFERMESLNLDSRAFGCTKVAAIGPATAEALALYGIRADCVPTQYVSEAVIDALALLGLRGERVLIPRANKGRVELVQGLENLGADVHDLPIYCTVVPEGSQKLAQELLKGGNIDVVTFTSSSTVTNLIHLLDGDHGMLRNALVACIGPITADTARRAGLHVDIVAQEYTVSGLVSAMVGFFTAKEVV